MVFRFGPNELNATSFELRRSGRRVHLASRPMELLLLLVRRPGELVSREEIARSLWPGLQVEDLVARINTAVAQIRGAIQEDASRPRYLETVIGKGYRFIGPVEQVAEQLAVTAPPATRPDPPRPLEMVLVTDLHGLYGALETAAEPESVSHDAQGPPAADHARIAVMELLALSPTELPAAAAPVQFPISPPARPRSGPRWMAAAAAVLLALGAVVSVLSKARRPQAAQPWESSPITTNDAEHPVGASAISPDSRLLAYTDPSGTFVRDLENGRTRLIPSPTIRATGLAWLPDQTGLVLTGFAPNTSGPEIWTLFAAGTPPRLLRRMAGDGAPSPDGRSVAFTADGGHQIKLARLDGSAEQTITRASSNQFFSQLVWSQDSRRISFQQRIPIQSRAEDIRMTFDSSIRTVDIATGRETAVIRNLPIDSAAIAADGRLFYLRTVGASDITDHGLWRVNTDPATGAFMGKPERLRAFGLFDLWTGISVSRQGKVAAIRQDWLPHIYVGQVNPDKSLSSVKQLTNEVAGDFPHSWSADGQSVYFESDRVGRKYHLFRQQLDRPSAEMLTVGDRIQIFPCLMPDGTTLVFEERATVNDKRERSILRANADAGEPRLVWKPDELDEWRCPTLSGQTCVLRKTEEQRLFTFYLLDLASGRGRELGHTQWQPSILGDWALSPDGQTVAIPNHDDTNPVIRLLPLDGSQRETEIKVRQSGQLWGIHWSPDGQGFYAELRSGPLHRLQFISLLGEVRLVRDTNSTTWGMPSRDGKRLAFIDAAESRNVFLWR